MRRLVALAAAALVAAACGGIDHGYVTAKRDVPAHTESFLRQVYVGQSCRTRTTGSGKSLRTTTDCSPNYLYLPDTRLVDRACFVALQNEKESGERQIGCDGWESVKINDSLSLK